MLIVQVSKNRQKKLSDLLLTSQQVASDGTRCKSRQSSSSLRIHMFDLHTLLPLNESRNTRASIDLGHHLLQPHFQDEETKGLSDKITHPRAHRVQWLNGTP